MNELKSPIFVADNEVHFLCPWIGFVVVNITEIICAASEKFDVYHVFQSPAYVLSSHRVLSVVLESRVYDICFRISDTILTFKGVLGENLDEECLTEKVCVFFAGLVIDTEDSGHVVVVNFLAGVVDQMIGNLSEGIDIILAIADASANLCSARTCRMSFSSIICFAYIVDTKVVKIYKFR